MLVRRLPVAGDHPRIRGEHLSWSTSSIGLEGSSPHTRGAHYRTRLLTTVMGIIPAYAGSTVSMTCSPMVREDHPRIRGEHIKTAAGWLGQAGSSPHTRGAHDRRCAVQRRWRIIPAYAGSTPKNEGFKKMPLGSSPHTRGAPRRRRRHAHRGRIIPAYAGSTASSHFADNTCWDHPRIRGEHGILPFRRQYLLGSSPHTRGAQTGGCPISRRVGIIPAYAGSTMLVVSRVHLIPDHPRIRGEHRPRTTESLP